MLRISWQTLRSRRGTLAGAFAAIFLAVTLCYAAGLLMTGALSPPGPGRFAAADAVVRADPTVELGGDLGGVDVIPAPRVRADLVDRASAVPGVEQAIGDVAFAAGAWDAAGRPLRTGGRSLWGHDWDGAVLTPYVLDVGEAPAGPGELVADAGLGVRVGDHLRVAAPVGDRDFRVTGLARAAGEADPDQAALFFASGPARALSGAPEHISAVGILAGGGAAPAELRARLQDRLGTGVEILDRDHAADADAGSPLAGDRDTLVAMFGTLAGIAGTVALFVVAGTFALAIAQRRRETAVLRALGATPRQVRRLIAGEAFLVSLAATALGLLAGGPLSQLIVDLLADHDAVPAGFSPVHSWVPLAGAFAVGVGIAQVAVVAAARRAGRTRPAEALREAAVEHARPGVLQILAGVVALAGGVAMSLVFSGLWAQAFCILGGILLAAGTGFLGRLLLGVPAAMLAWPLRALGAAGLLASTALAANRWRTAALATPVVLIAMLAGTQGLVQSSDQQDVQRVTAARVTAEHVVRGRDGAPLPAGTGARLAGLDGVRGVAEIVPTEVYGLDHGLGEESPWRAAGLDATATRGTLDLGVLAGDLGAVHGDGIAVSRVLAHDGGLELGDDIAVRMADTGPRSFRVVAVYDRAAGLGDVVMDAGLARRHTVGAPDATAFVAGGRAAGRSLAAYAAAGNAVEVADRAAYLETVDAANQEDAWGVWLIVALTTLFAALALVNAAAMATTERRDELATIRLLGGTSGQVARMVALEMATTVAVAIAAGGVIVAVAVAGVPRGLTGIPLAVPATLTAGLIGGIVALGVAATVIAARLALRASPTEAMRLRD
jgi:putative ABC transport system permease protein